MTRSTADKIDYGILTFRATPSDLKNLEDVITSVGGFEQREPNFAHWVYKNRAGLDHIVIWTQMDLGSMREIPLFITDYNYNLVTDVKRITGVVVDEEEYQPSEEEADF